MQEESSEQQEQPAATPPAQTEAAVQGTSQPDATPDAANVTRPDAGYWQQDAKTTAANPGENVLPFDESTSTEATTEFSADQEQQRQQLIAEFNKKIGFSERTLQHLDSDPAARTKWDQNQQLLSTYPPEKLQQLLEFTNQRSSQYQKEVAVALIDPSAKDAQQQIDNLAEQLKVLDLSNLYNFSLPDQTGLEPEQARAQLKENVHQACFDTFVDEVQATFGADLHPAALTNLQHELNKAYYQNEDLSVTLEFLSNFKKFQSLLAENGVTQEEAALLLGWDKASYKENSIPADGQVIPAEAAPITPQVETTVPTTEATPTTSVNPDQSPTPDQSVTQEQSASSGEATVQLTPEQQTKRQKIILALGAWSSDAIQSSSVSTFIDNFFGQYDGRRSFAQYQEAWKAPEGKETTSKADLVKEINKVGPQALAEKLDRMYSEGRGNPKVNLRDVGGLELGVFDKLKEPGANKQAAIKAVFNEVLKWMFDGTNDQQKARQLAWNVVFVAELFDKDDKVLGTEGMRWFADEYTKQPADRWKDFTANAWQEQAAVAA